MTGKLKEEEGMLEGQAAERWVEGRRREVLLGAEEGEEEGEEGTVGGKEGVGGGGGGGGRGGGG